MNQLSELIDRIANQEYWGTRENYNPKFRERFLIQSGPIERRGPNDEYRKFLLEIVRRIDSFTADQLDHIARYMMGMDEDQITGNISIMNHTDYKIYVDVMNKYFVELLDKDSSDRYIINNTTISILARNKIQYPNPCRYGINCYRKNSQHIAEYQHPDQSFKKDVVH